MNKAVEVLIIESKNQDVDLILSVLNRNKNLQHKPDIVHSLEHAEDKLIGQVYDIVIFGLNLSEAENLEFVKKFYGIFQVPMVLLSSVKDEVLIKEHRIDYVIDYINKHSLSPLLLGQSIKFGIERNTLKQKLYKAEKKARYLTTRDPLTNLLNRNTFFEQINSEINTSQRNKLQFGLLFLGINNLKKINECYGHGTGDIILELIAERLQKRLRQEDKLSRVNGDGFGILVSDIEDPHLLVNISRNVLRLFNEPFEIKGKQFYLTASTGITIYPNDALNLEDIVRNAETALSVAKEKGFNNFQYYTENINRDVSHRLSLEHDFRRGIDKGEFFLQYQPLIKSSISKIVCAEALVRWQHPDKGLLAPDNFIHIFEQSGLISELGHWVLREACLQNKRWQDAGLPRIRIAVNISPKQFINHDLVRVVKEVLDETKLHPKWLELELTEHVFMNDADHAFDVINQLKELGIQISIDDFGTGFSSLSYLKSLPIDKLKVDKSFIHALNANSRDSVIVQAIITMAQNLTIETIAEGIETSAQKKSIQNMGCNYMQGFFFQEPVKSRLFTQLLKDQASVSNGQVALN